MRRFNWKLAIKVFLFVVLLNGLFQILLKHELSLNGFFKMFLAVIGIPLWILNMPAWPILPILMFFGPPNQEGFYFDFIVPAIIAVSAAVFWGFLLGFIFRRRSNEALN